MRSASLRVSKRSWSTRLPSWNSSPVTTRRLRLPVGTVNLVVDIVELFDLAVDLAQRASQLLLDEAPDRAEDVATKSSRTDMVTAVDRASEALIVGTIEKERPDDGVLGEEGSKRDGTSGVRWIIDPLDGTTNYLYGFPVYAVSIGVEVNGEVEAGVVVHPTLQEVFTARRGEGAQCNGATIAVSDKADLSTALIGTGFAYDSASVRDVRRAGAAAVDLCWVACGRLDGYYEAGLSPWDVAAGELIAREAGAQTSDFEGGPVRADHVIAATPGIGPPLRHLVSEAVKL
ncbi:MAG: inositol monophosphatase [Actinobacteria bacterium]|nr:MAG: inositol monophosphatase [Actinomycetota bacterium]